MKRKIMIGDPEELEVFVEFEASSEVKNSELEELEKAYDSVHTIYKNRGALT